MGAGSIHSATFRKERTRANRKFAAKIAVAVKVAVQVAVEVTADRFCC